MEENKEKNKIKISLGTFTVLIVSILILAMAIVLGFQKANEKTNIPQPATGKEQAAENENIDKQNEKDYFLLYRGEEIKGETGTQLLTDGMQINNYNIKKYNTTYYNYENGKYLGTTKGIFGTDETGTYEGLSVVGNVKTLAVSQNYNLMPRAFTNINNLPNELVEMADYSSVNIQEIDLDNDGNKEHILCWTIDYSAEDFENKEPEAKSGIELYDSNYKKIANLVKLDNGFWANIKDASHKIFLTLDEVTYADIDRDGIMEIIIEMPNYENYDLGIYKYKNGYLYGEVNYIASVQP